MTPAKPPGFYAWVGLVFLTMASIGVNVLISINLANRAKQAQQEVACDIAITQSDVYRASPPSTATGVRASRAWENARVRWCKEEG